MHCARWRKSTGIETHCDLDDRYLGYLVVMDTERKCRNWEMEKELPTATSMQKLYENGYREGQKKAFDECDEIARELSHIKSGCSEWLDGHDKVIYSQAIDDVYKALYHEAFETDTDLQKWDSGCWIRFKMVENITEQLKKGGKK